MHFDFVPLRLQKQVHQFLRGLEPRSHHANDDLSMGGPDTMIKINQKIGLSLLLVVYIEPFGVTSI